MAVSRGPPAAHSSKDAMLAVFKGRSSMASSRVVYRDVMTVSGRHDATGRDGPFCQDTIGSA